MTDIDSHFRFGDNWASYAHLIDEKACENAIKGMLKLATEDELKDCNFLDIGCGSGVHSVAALRLGAKRVLALDLDPVSVSTTRGVLSRFAPDADWEVIQENILHSHPGLLGTFDVVYAWGVLHHTGALVEGLRVAAALVGQNGLFIFALYPKTRLDQFWTWEKRFYSMSPSWVQAMVRGAYVLSLRAYFAMHGQRFRDHLKNYRQRGMDFAHDVHDWLGGYPYETISPDEVQALMTSMGFEKVRCFTKPYGYGVFGSDNNEFVYRRSA